MQLSSRLDYRVFLIIITLIMVMYWLFLPKASDDQKNKEIDVLMKHDGFKKMLLKTDHPLQSIEESKKMEAMAKEIENLKEEKRDMKMELESLKIQQKQQVDQNNEKNMKKMDEEIIKVSKKSDELLKENEDLKQQLKEKTTTKEDTESSPVTKPFIGQKLVHLDLKGAPPKLNYLLDFIKFSKKQGADGFLLEYEDMFPWYDDLEILRSKHAYTEDDIKKILKTIDDQKMIAIPLVQTFGHLEFVLKHDKFKHLRATPEIISALHVNSSNLIKTLIDQIIKLHPDSQWIHLGADEVWNMRTCEGCSNSNLTDAELFLYHMKPLFAYINSMKTTAGVERKPIIWDDMMRWWSVSELNEIGKLAFPMVWAYEADLDNYSHFPTDIWERYSKSFDQLWLASSFKGGLKPWSNFVPIKQHVDNHLSWLKITTKLIEQKVKVNGIVLTGWSRFDHYGPLCELLPVGIPSLTLCLTVLQKGKFDAEIHETVSTKLGFSKPFTIGTVFFKWYVPEYAKFPGSDVYYMVGQVAQAIGWTDWVSFREFGWIRTNETADRWSHHAINTSISGMETSIAMLDKVKLNATKILSNYFEQYVVEEWISDKIDYYNNLSKFSIQKMKKKLEMFFTD